MLSREGRAIHCVLKIDRVNVVASRGRSASASKSGNEKGEEEESTAATSRVAELLVGDETGSICMLVEGSEAVDTVIGADAVVVTNARIERFDGAPRLVVYQDGSRVRMYPDPEVTSMSSRIISVPSSVLREKCLTWGGVHVDK